MAVTLAVFCALSAEMKLKMVVNAGVVRCGPVSTFQIGSNPSATLSFESAGLS